MSAGGSGEASAGAISSVHLLILGIVGGLIGIYVAPYSTLFGSAIAGLGGVCAIVWGADAIRRVASYGLGTGVPSIGYMSLSIGIIGALAGIGIGYSFPQLEIAGPVIGLIFAMIIGLIIAIFQATTSIQEQTLTFAPKFFVILAVLALLGGWMFTSLRGYTVELFQMISRMGR